jgi:hypothetical protein
MTKAIIHVNRQFIAMNAKDGRNRPCYTIKIKGKAHYCRGFTSNASLKGVAYGDQLACGARVWLETEAEGLTMIDEMSFEEAKAS